MTLEKSNPEVSRRQLLQGAAALVALGGSAWVRGQNQSGEDEREAVRERVRTPGPSVPVNTSDIREAFPRTAEGIEAAAAAGRSGQLYVSLAGSTIINFAWGKTPGGDPLQPNTLVSWASAVKPTSCVPLMQWWEKGKLDLDDPVTSIIPEFGSNGKDKVRIRHLLTHTAHLGGYRGPTQLPDTWEQLVTPIIRAERVPYGPVADAGLPQPGYGPGYNPAGIIIAAEIARRLDGGRRPFEQILREDVYLPAGMKDSWCGMPVAQYRDYHKAGRFGSNYMNAETEIAKCQPAGGGIGPTRELARFYELMLGRGTINGNRIVSPQTVEAMSTPKTGFCYMGIWGLGFNIGAPENSAPVQGAVTRAERFGPHASPRTFGHAGASGMQAYADPEYGLVVAHIGRAGIDGAIYEDLRLVQK